MATIAHVKVNWTGFIGSPGYTNFYFETGTGEAWTQTLIDECVTKVNAFLGAWPAYMPSGVTLTIDSAVGEIDEGNGALQSVWSITPPAARVGSNPGNYAAGAGACVSWATADVRNGRRVRGRTFMIPLGPAGLSGDGTLDTTALTSWRTAATALHSDVNNARLVVWARPGPLGIPSGGAYNVTGSSIADKAAQLRSRRD